MTGPAVPPRITARQITDAELVGYRRQLENAIAFFDRQDPVQDRIATTYGDLGGMTILLTSLTVSTPMRTSGKSGAECYRAPVLMPAANCCQISALKVSTGPGRFLVSRMAIRGPA
jgi:hypothetical protein